MSEEFYSKPDNLFIQRKLKEYKELYIHRFFPEDKSAKILDLGCGYGLFLAACRRYGYRNVYGADAGLNFVDYAKDKLGLENVVCGDIFAYLEGTQDSSFDVIVAMNFVEHIKKEKVPLLFSSIYQKLRSGGTFIVEAPNADSIHGIHTFFSDLTHEWAYTNALITRLLQIQGFADIKVFPNRVRANKIIRLLQKMLTKIVSGDDLLQYSGNLIAIARK